MPDLQPLFSNLATNDSRMPEIVDGVQDCAQRGKGHSEESRNEDTSEIAGAKGGTRTPRFYPPDPKFAAYEESTSCTWCD
jgi:hypothetical protein